MLLQLRENRAKLIADARAVLDAADKEKRSPSKEEHARFDEIMAKADEAKADIDRRERIEAEERALNDTRGRQTDPTKSTGGDKTITVTAEQRDMAMRAWAKVPALGHPTQSGIPVTISPEERAAADACGMNLDRKVLTFRLMPTGPRSLAEIERRAALGVGSAGIGGNTVPNEPIRALETAMLNFGGMRQLATVIRTGSGATLPWPTSDDTANKGEIIGENSATNEQEMTFGVVNFSAFKYSSKHVKVAVEFLQDTSIDFPSWIGARLGERIGRILNDHLTTGAGTTLPKGIVVAGTSGVTAASATAVTADEVLDLIHSVDPSYRVGPQVGMMFNDSTLKFIRKLKDGEGRYIWQPGMAGVPDTIFGQRYVINQSMDSIATTKKPIVYGDFSKYIIRDVLEVTLLRLDELFAASHQVAFLAFSRHDGNLVDAGTHPIKFITQP